MKRNYQILAVLFLLVLALGGLLGWSYTIMQEKKTAEIALRTELLEESQKGNKMKAQKRTLALISDNHKELSAFLYEPSEESQIKFLSEIEQLGTTTTGALVETKSLSLTEGESTSFYGEFSISGTWGQVYHVLRLIEEFPSRIVIERFDVKMGSSVNEWSGTFSLHLTSLKGTK